MRYLGIICLTILFSCLWQGETQSAMTGGNFEIYADSFSFTNQQVSEGGNFTLFDTGGEFFATSTSGGDYSLKGGFQALEKGILSFSISDASVALGTFSLASVTSADTIITVSTDSATGYTLTLTENGNLCSPSVAVCTYDINDVADGSVTAGSEEYGIRTSGTNGQQNSADVPISGTVSIATSSGITTGDATTVSYKAAISTNSIAGAYTHTTSYTLTVNP